jgi:hypothetical protein
MAKQPTIAEIVSATRPLAERMTERRIKDAPTIFLYADRSPPIERRTPAQIARDPGFYWVKDDDTRWTVGQWRVSEWDGRAWYAIGHDDSDDYDPPHIGPRLQEPSE